SLISFVGRFRRLAMHAEKTDILAQRPSRPGLAHQLVFGVLLALVPTLTVLTAFGIVPGTSMVELPQALVVEPLDLPELEAASPVPARYTTQERVLRGDTVA